MVVGIASQDNAEGVINIDQRLPNPQPFLISVISFITQHSTFPPHPHLKNSLIALPHVAISCLPSASSRYLISSVLLYPILTSSSIRLRVSSIASITPFL